MSACPILLCKVYPTLLVNQAGGTSNRGQYCQPAAKLIVVIEPPEMGDPLVCARANRLQHPLTLASLDREGVRALGCRADLKLTGPMQLNGAGPSYAADTRTSDWWLEHTHLTIDTAADRY